MNYECNGPRSDGPAQRVLSVRRNLKTWKRGRGTEESLSGKSRLQRKHNRLGNGKSLPAQGLSMIGRFRWLGNVIVLLGWVENAAN